MPEILSVYGRYMAIDDLLVFLEKYVSEMEHLWERIGGVDHKAGSAKLLRRKSRLIELHNQCTLVQQSLSQQLRRIPFLLAERLAKVMAYRIEGVPDVSIRLEVNASLSSKERRVVASIALIGLPQGRWVYAVVRGDEGDLRLQVIARNSGGGQWSFQCGFINCEPEALKSNIRQRLVDILSSRKDRLTSELEAIKDELIALS